MAVVFFFNKYFEKIIIYVRAKRDILCECKVNLQFLRTFKFKNLRLDWIFQIIEYDWAQYMDPCQRHIQIQNWFMINHNWKQSTKYVKNLLQNNFNQHKSILFY